MTKANNKRRSFSLVEVTVAIGIIGFALIAILGLIPVGTRSARESIDVTYRSLLAQHVASRIRATMSSNDAAFPTYYTPYSSGIASFFFFTSDGQPTGELLKVLYPNDQPQNYANVRTPTDFYRAKVVVAVFDQTVAYTATDPRKVAPGGQPELMCATVEIAAPIDSQRGSVIGSSQKVHYSFVVRKP